MSIEQSATIGQLAAALAAAAPTLQDARKDRANPHLKNRYATLESVLEAVREPLAALGVAVTQGVSAAPGVVTVTTQLSHSSGEWMRSSLTLPVPAGKGISEVQALGSTVTYGRRYGLAAMCGIGAEERDDDDGDVGRGVKPPPRQQAEKAARVAPDHHESWTDAERARFCAALRDLGQSYDAVAARLEAKGSPRPSAMNPKQRSGILEKLRAEAGPAEAR
jgi:hypothetical protein